MFFNHSFLLSRKGVGMSWSVCYFMVQLDSRHPVRVKPKTISQWHTSASNMTKQIIATMESRQQLVLAMLGVFGSFLHKSVFEIRLCGAKRNTVFIRRGETKQQHYNVYGFLSPNQRMALCDAGSSTLTVLDNCSLDLQLKGAQEWSSQGLTTQKKKSIRNLWGLQTTSGLTLKLNYTQVEAIHKSRVLWSSLVRRIVFRALYFVIRVNGVQYK